MLKPEIFEFCEDYAISIKKFLNDNFILESNFVKTNKKNKRWKIKHSEIAGMCNVIPVSLLFAYRYKELVAMGKILIVEDEYGRYNAYINPRIIVEAYGIESDPQLENEGGITSYELADTEENLRIIRHFNGSTSIEYTHGLINTLEETKNTHLTRKRVEKEKDVC